MQLPLTYPFLSVTLALTVQCKASIQEEYFTLSAPSSNESSVSLMGYSSDMLVQTGFERVTEVSFCGQALLAEKRSVVFRLRDALVCAKTFKQERIRHEYISSADLKKLVNRNKLHATCEAGCTLRVQKNRAVVTTRDGEKLQFKQGGLLFEKFEELNIYPEHSIWILWTLALVVMYSKKTSRLAAGFLGASLLMMTGIYEFPAKYSLDVIPPYSDNTIRIQNYQLHNVSIEILRRGRRRGPCLIYMCNRFTGVRNFRFKTDCDVVNVYVSRVTFDEREVSRNWLKVLVGMWLLEETAYRTFVYADRDLILTSTPLHRPVAPIVFPNLGGGRPDSAMFILNTEMLPSRAHMQFLRSWLRRETGKTGRRDGGEEQEALLQEWSKQKFQTADDLYSFQCGRNALNRAECLLRNDRVVVNWAVLRLKLFFETSRMVLFNSKRNSPTFLTPLATMSQSRHIVLRNFGPCLSAVLELGFYIYLFDSKQTNEIDCSANARASISFGSFDNPVYGSMTGIFADGIAERTSIGWRCFSFGSKERRWSIREAPAAVAFMLAQVVVIAVGYFTNVPHLLNPIANLSETTIRKTKNPP